MLGAPTYSQGQDNNTTYYSAQSHLPVPQLRPPELDSHHHSSPALASSTLNSITLSNRSQAISHQLQASVSRPTTNQHMDSPWWHLQPLHISSNSRSSSRMW